MRKIVRTGISSALLVWLVLSFAVIFAPGVKAYRFLNTKWSSATTTFNVDIPGRDGLWNTAFEEAMTRWNTATVFDFQTNRNTFEDPCAAEPLISDFHQNGVGFSDTVCGDAFGESTLAVTSASYSPEGFIETNIIFNTAYSWDVYDGPYETGQWAGIEDFRRIAVHELGHALGLDHEDDVPAIMASRVAEGDTIVAPTADDIAGVAAIYTPIYTPPSNDLFSNAITISGPSGSTTGRNAEATEETNEPGLGTLSVWWRWEAPSDGMLTVDTAGSNFDTILGLYAGTQVGALRVLAENDDDDDLGPQSRVTLEVTAGTVYWFRVAGFGSLEGNIVLNWNLGPSNDLFSNAITISGPSGRTTGRNAGATVESGERGMGTHSVWWQWRAPSHGAVTIDTVGSSFDTTLGVYTGTRVDVLTSLAENDDALGLQSRVTLDVTAGTVYRLRVAGYDGDTGTIVLNWNLTASTVLLAHFANGNNTVFNSRVYLFNPSVKTGRVTVRVFTLPLRWGLAQELTTTPLELGSLGPKSGLNIKLVEDILTPLGITTPYTIDGGNLTLELTILAPAVRGTAQVFSSGFGFGTYPLQEIPITSGASPTVLVANFANGNNAAFNSRVYLWNPSTSAGEVTVRVFTLPLGGGLAQELTLAPLALGTLGARSALNVKLAENILTPLGVSLPYTIDGGNLTLEFTIQAADVKGAAQVFSSDFAFGTQPLQEIPPVSGASPTVLVANFMNGNNAAFNSRVYLFNPSTSAGEVTVRVFTLPLADGTVQELTVEPLALDTLGSRSALNIKLAEDILTPLGIATPYTTDDGNLTLEFTIQAADVRGTAQVFSSTFASGTYTLQAVPSVPIPGPTRLVASFTNGNDTVFNSRISLFNPSPSAGGITVRVFHTPLGQGHSPGIDHHAAGAGNSGSPIGTRH